VSRRTRVLSSTTAAAGRWSRRPGACCWSRPSARPTWTPRYQRRWRRGGNLVPCTTRA